MKLDTQEIREQIKCADDAANLTSKALTILNTKAIPAWTVLTQLDPTQFKGFMGFVTNKGAIPPVNPNVIIAPPPLHPGGTANAQPVTIPTQPFIDSINGFIVSNAYVEWNLNGSTLSGTITTNAQGIASVTFPPNSLTVGTHVLQFHTSVNHGIYQEPLDQTVSFTVTG